LESKKELKQSVNEDVTETEVVFGYYPFWLEYLYSEIDFSGYTVVSYNSAKLNPENGDIIRVREWGTTPLIDTLKNNDIPYLFAISNSGKENNGLFLKNSEAIDHMVNRSLELIKLRQANGILIDFTDIGLADRSGYASFLTRLHSELIKADSNSMLYITIPVLDENKSFDFPVLNNIVDQFVLPPKDEDGLPKDLSESFDYYLDVGIPKHKLLRAIIIDSEEE
jgi:hypothetical protein